MKQLNATHTLTSKLLRAAIGALVISVGFIVTSPVGATSTKLSARLLSIAQLPKGWTTDASSSGSGIGCLANTLEPRGIKQTANAGIKFAYKANLPVFEEKVAGFTDVQTAYQQILGNLGACKRINTTSSGQKITGTVEQISLPNYGNASAGFLARLTSRGTTLEDDVLIVRESTLILGMSEINVNNVDIAQFQGLAAKAIKKLQ